MRIISGTCKGRRIKAPKGKHIRPALDQVKEAVFNILFDVSDLEVLDLFAGSGSMGLEALSRGARHAVFVERDAAACSVIRTNLASLKLEHSATVIAMPVLRAIEHLARMRASFNLIFVDPPYLKDEVMRTLDHLASSTIVQPNAVIVIEHHPKEPIGNVPELTLTDSRKYGQTLITFMKKRQKANG